MFLPVLLVRDYGVWGFVVFGVPNVIGAAAMGWVLRSAQAARRIRAAHAGACKWFSVVTIAFQLFFLMSLSQIGPVLWIIAAIVIGGTLGFRGWGAVGAWLGSAAALAVAWRAGDLTIPPESGVLPDESVLYLAPVCVFGFALCPYLDLTFLRARAETTDAQSRSAFSLGFGVLFLAMIVGTLLYASFALGVLRGGSFPANRAGAAAILLHIAAQLSFTIWVHMDELARPASEDEGEKPARVRAETQLMGAVIAATVMLGAGVVLARWRDGLSGAMTGFEIAYRLFMSFYGLVFPAYVWLCMIPARGEMGTQRPTRRKRAVLGVACLLAAPCYWMGFIEREAVWLVPGLGVVLVARLFVRPEAGGRADEVAA